VFEDVLDWFEEFLDTYASEMVGTVAVLIGAVVVIWFVKRGIRRWSTNVDRRYVASDQHVDRERGQRLVTLTSVALVLVRIVVWVLAILTIMGIWGIPMSPFVAAAATIGIAIGFGAQDLVKDVIAGFFILVEDQFGIGDVVSIGGVSGTVEAITLRTTVLRDLDGNEYHIPNGHIVVTTNMTQGFARVVADIGVSYSTDIDRAMSVILDEATSMADDPGWSEAFLGAPEMLGVNDLSDSSVEVRLVAKVLPEERWTVKREFNRRIKVRLDAEGIEIPYNHISVVIQSNDD
jgi:small-conductance mechanosensitive channel